MEARLHPYRTVYAAPAERARLAATPDAKIAYNLYFQRLNLFVICGGFRRQATIEHQVLASLVAWFYDTIDDWYVREMWEAEIGRGQFGHTVTSAQVDSRLGTRK